MRACWIAAAVVWRLAGAPAALAEAPPATGAARALREAISDRAQRDPRGLDQAGDGAPAWEDGDAGGAIDLLARRAAALYHAGRHGEAVRAYDRAASEAFRAGAAGRAFELATAAAAVAQRRGDAADAAQRFRRAALAAPRRSDAPDAHHAGMLCYAEALAAGAADLAPAHRDALAEHLRVWPASPHATATRRALASALADAGDWPGAVDQWEALADRAGAGAAGDRAVRDLARGYAAWVEHTRGAQRRAALTRATSRLQPLITGADNTWPEAWTPLMRDVALVLARGHAVRPDGGADYARRLLGQAMVGAPPPSEAWRREARRVLQRLSNPAPPTAAVGAKK